MRFARLAGLLPGKLLVAVGIGVVILGASTPASADEFAVTYFSVSGLNNNAGSDFHAGGVTTGTGSSNYVSGSLSGGMPVYNPSFTAAAGYSTPAGAGDVSGGGVLEWWTPGTYNGNVITETGAGTLNLSSSPTNMFPPDSTGTNNNNAEETAILSGDFDLSSPGSVSFGVAEDDDAFIYVDGTYVGGLGGIHALGSLLNVNTGTLSAGWHNVEIFYADQDQVAASLAFTSSVPISATPEPGSLALLGTGVLGLAGTLRRRFMR
ncbi:MAG TPA: PEP-CTERM sorting domain-containing protein [Acidobacteriaceae bacterium]|nr:PEP-CTERM sorting domain-containing protein [Acidobacteriaceae bacterium]